MSLKTPQSGFTLLEIILAIMVTAVLSAIILQAMGTNVQRSTYPLFAVRNSLSLQQVMDNITADYKRLFLTEANPMSMFQDRIADNEYWTPAESFSSQIKAVAFETDDCGDPATYDTCFKELHAECSGQDCHVYRLTITQTSTGRSLSAFFTD